MISKNDSPRAKAAALGARLKQARLNRDMSQLELSEKSGLSRRSIMNAEKGHVSLEDLIALLDSLGVRNSIDSMLPDQPVSPMELLKLKGRVRQKASGENKSKTHYKIKTAKVNPEW